MCAFTTLLLKVDEVFAETRVDFAPILLDDLICVLLYWTDGEVGGSDGL